MGVYIIAEAGVNHNGSIETAKQLVDVAVNCHADAIKFQTFLATESTGENASKAEYQICNDPIDETQLDMLRKLELPFEAFGIINQYCKEKKIDFISTPDGINSLECLLKLDVPVIKVASPEITNLDFLKQIAKTGKKIILSTGMSTLGEVERALEVLKNNGSDEIQLMHCTTDYPTSIEDVNLKAMITMRHAFGIQVGFSDHTVGVEAAIAATALGASCIEKHITLDREMPGPDHKASMPPEEFHRYVLAIRNTEIILGDGIKKPTENEKKIMKQVRRSILSSREIKKGTIITPELICYKRPGTGISPEFVDIVIGKTIKRDKKKEEPITWDDI